MGALEVEGPAEEVLDLLLREAEAVGQPGGDEDEDEPREGRHARPRPS